MLCRFVPDILQMCMKKFYAENFIFEQIFDNFLYSIMVGSAYFVKSTPPRAFIVYFQFFADLFQIYCRCACRIVLLKMFFLTNLQLFKLSQF